MRNLNILVLTFCYCLVWVPPGALGKRPTRFSSELINLGRVRGCEGGESAEENEEEDEEQMEEELSSWLVLLEKERKLNPALDKAWSQAWLEWARMKEGGSSAPGGLRDELVVAVVCYALEYPPPPLGPLYLVFNQASRHCLGAEDLPEACERFRGLHQLLGLALRGLRRAERAQGKEGAPGMVYRGSPRPFWAKVGDTVQFGSFTSTSASRDVAEIFAGGGGVGGTLFHIRTARGASVEELSPFPQEREVLIPPCEAFRVDRVERSEIHGQPRIDLHLTSLQLSGEIRPRCPGPLYLLTLALTLARQLC
ncbi:erythroblast NAD(P)(+)--arginine ADP-ribosyltransferase-like [Rhincodon typus]|uniref:erythroblast NAD(P)(+)--arginine ADP-ribosyltransferase-like n=1 Tax=Rhincodon typus TaxID=259920 RepID=UPI00202FF263|nr:erythroblast NAD(P)(+)--arginine ADP-ribosyltransferase-like [Rhincodon typus]